MPREPRAYLYDIAHAAGLIADFTAGLDFDAYLNRPMVRAAVERQLEIIGEGGAAPYPAGALPGVGRTWRLFSLVARGTPHRPRPAQERTTGLLHDQRIWQRLPDRPETPVMRI